MSNKNSNNLKEVIFEDDQEIIGFEEFKKSVEELDQDDKTLIRFFRARDRDLTKAKDMLVANLQWRKENKIDSYVDWKPQDFPFMKNDFNVQYRITGKDHDGRIVLWFPIGSILGKECIQAGHKELLFQFLYNMLETGVKVIKESGKAQAVFLMGLENATLRQVMFLECLQSVYQGVQILERNYPETLKHAILINAPWVFPMAYNFVKPVIASKTLEKIQIFNSDKTKWMPKLLEIMPIESIPEEYFDA